MKRKKKKKKASFGKSKILKFLEISCNTLSHSKHLILVYGSRRGVL